MAETPQASQGRIVPAPFIEMNFAFAQSCIALASVELNIYTLIAQGYTTADQIATHAEVHIGSLVRLLDALCALRLLNKEGENYMLTPLSDLYLVRGKPSYLGDVALQTRHEWDAWIHLSDIVRKGESFRSISEEPVGPAFNAPLAEYLFPIVYPLMKRLAQHLQVGTAIQGANILDLGSGAAPGAVAMLQQDPTAHAVAVDFAEVLERAKVSAQRHKVQERIQFHPADLATLTLPASQFDIVIISHVCRVVGVEVTQHLLHQCFQALKPGGKLLLVEYYKELDDFSRIFPHIISLNMLVNTRSGDTFSSAQMQSLVTAEGFEVELLRGFLLDPVLLATHPL